MRQDPKTKGTNPKSIVGSNKLPLHLWPSTATAVGCLGFLDGMLKYGYANYRVSGVRASVYIAAALRHILAYLEGEECASDSKVPHLGHALACLAILVDAKAAGVLNDDRPYPGGYNKLVEELLLVVEYLKKSHADKNPRHYTIKDNLNESETRRPRLDRGRKLDR